MSTRTTTSPARRDQPQPQQRPLPRLIHLIHHREVDGTVHAMCGQVLRNARFNHPGDKINCAACDAARHLLEVMP